MRIRVLNGDSRRDPRETLDVFVGIVGFFTFAFFVIAALAEVTGQDALGWALTLLAFVVVLALLLAARHRMTTKMQERRTRPERSDSSPEKTDVIRP